MCLYLHSRTDVRAELSPGLRRTLRERAKENVNDEQNVARRLQKQTMGKPSTAKWRKGNGGNNGGGKKSKSKGKGSQYNPTEPEPVVPALDCFFTFKYDDIIAFQVENGDVVEYEQILNDDDGNIAICKGNNCAGEPNEIVGVATGRCSTIENVLEFTVATDEDPQFMDFEVYCPDILWVGGGECTAIDIATEAPLEFNPVVNVIGPEVTITEIEFQSLVRCRIVCTPRL